METDRPLTIRKIRLKEENFRNINHLQVGVSDIFQPSKNRNFFFHTESTIL